MTSETVKVCFKCKHYRGRRDSLGAEPSGTSDCFKTKQSETMHLVTGIYFSTYRTAIATRMDETACGIGGNWWELYEAPMRDIPILQPITVKPIKVSVKGVTADDL